MLSSHNHEISNILSDVYPNEFVTFKIIAYQGDISVFVFSFADEKRLENNWSKISGNIAGNYQADLTDVFKIWNIYLLLICPAKISIALKYKIENDRFSSRKIVVDQFVDELSEICVNDIIEHHITNKDIKYVHNVAKPEKLRYDTEADPAIWDLIKVATLKQGKQSSGEVQELLSKIEENLRDENKQS